MNRAHHSSDQKAAVPRVSAAFGAAEKAADHAASQAMLGQSTGAALDVLADGTASVPDHSAQSAVAATQAGGTPLPPEERAFFEPKFGRDLSGIRLHTDAQTGRAAQGIEASAYAHGDHIGFAPGEFSTDRMISRPRLGHEIAHSLQQRARPGPPVIQRDPPTVNPEIANLPANRYVDAYREVHYDLDYRAVGGNLSRFLTVTYHDGAQIDLDLFDIEDREVNMVEAMANGRLGAQGRVFPSDMTRTTVPRLWAAAQEAIAVMEQHNYEFMVAALPAVIFIITLAGAPPLTGSSPVVRRQTRTRPTTPRTPAPSAATGATGRTAAGPGTTAAAGSVAAGGGGAAAGQSFRIVGNRVLRYSGRDIVVVETSAGRQAFYRRTGLGGTNAGGAQAGQWAPFDGLLAGWFDKTRYVAGAADDVLYRFGTAENRSASEWLSQQGVRAGNDVGEVFSIVNQFLDDLGALRMGGG